MAFDTLLYLCGPLRQPRQMLADQEYSGHSSIHDDSMAEKLGFRAGPIEGPTHFSQFVPLLVEVFGQAWFERGCFSSHFQNMVVEGEQVRAFVERRTAGSNRVRCWAEKADGTPVLEASASLGPNDGPTLLEERMAKLPGSVSLVEASPLGLRCYWSEKGGEPVLLQLAEWLKTTVELMEPYILRQSVPVE